MRDSIKAKSIRRVMRGGRRFVNRKKLPKSSQLCVKLTEFGFGKERRIVAKGDVCCPANYEDSDYEKKVRGLI